MVTEWQDFTVVTKLIKHFKNLYGFGRCAVSTLQTFVWILNHVSRSITWSLFTLKASNLVKRQLWTWFFMWQCQFIEWLKFETRPSSLHKSGMANLKQRLRQLKTLQQSSNKFRIDVQRHYKIAKIHVIHGQVCTLYVQWNLY